MAEEIRYLEKEEKKKALALWSQAFFEDSEEFKNYYFTEKIRENRILVKEEDGQIISMIHLNPYKIRLEEKICLLDYIVGVATDKEKRHQGHMRELLGKMLRDGHQEGKPFCFLMPADKAIYEPFDFRFVFRQPQWEKKNLEGEAGIRIVSGAASEEQNFEELSSFMESWMRRRFQVYGIRDQAYAANLVKELASEEGIITRIYQGNTLAGLEAVWGQEEKERRFLYFPEAWIKEAGAPKPAIMARILNLKNFLELFALKEGEPAPVEILLDVTDPLIPENTGLWRWSLTVYGSEAEHKTAYTEGENDPFSCSAAQLIQWLMGDKKAGSIDSQKEFWPSWGSRIRGFRKIYLDEIV